MNLRHLFTLRSTVSNVSPAQKAETVAYLTEWSFFGLYLEEGQDSRSWVVQRRAIQCGPGIARQALTILKELVGP